MSTCERCGAKTQKLWSIEPDEYWDVPRTMDVCWDCEQELEMNARLKAAQELIDEINGANKCEIRDDLPLAPWQGC